jgi:hypothetical protein
VKNQKILVAWIARLPEEFKRLPEGRRQRTERAIWHQRVATLVLQYVSIRVNYLPGV